MAGIYGYMFCILCILDFIYLSDALCKYVKRDVAYKVVKSDVVLSGKIIKVNDGDSKYFPGIQGAQTLQFEAECIYKGGDMTKDVTIYGFGVFEDSSGMCHNTSIPKEPDTIVYLERKENGELVNKYLNDPINYLDELTICGEKSPKLAKGQPVPDYFEDVCPFYEDECIQYIEPTTKATDAPTTPSPEPETSPVTPKPTTEKGVRYSIKPQVKDGENGASRLATLTSITSTIAFSTFLVYLLV
ncbi:uncharacterized protein LOC133187495 [Saccostrea echinata]|uniref:uncharacterized protein LOC133187495 n=1 Tax=Saccostrea echinata TaxID=191078 RepID=UPI002A7FD183|nr:uncharacterized protein LOC133187495 [Saccostrea echinata]